MTPGARAERAAERHLRKRGYNTLARNLRVGRNELDLVMLAPDHTTVVVVEVKSSAMGTMRARGALDAGKRRRIGKAIQTLERLRLLEGFALRVDGILVDTSSKRAAIEHLPGRPLPPR